MTSGISEGCSSYPAICRSPHKSAAPCGCGDAHPRSAETLHGCFALCVFLPVILTRAHAVLSLLTIAPHSVYGCEGGTLLISCDLQDLAIRPTLGSSEVDARQLVWACAQWSWTLPEIRIPPGIVPIRTNLTDETAFDAFRCCLCLFFRDAVRGCSMDL